MVYSDASHRSDLEAIQDEAERLGELIDVLLTLARTGSHEIPMSDVELDDVVRKRTFTVAGATQNRPYGEGPPWFADSRPVGLGCRVSGLASPEMVVEVEAMAVKGAHAGIEWLEIAE